MYGKKLIKRVGSLVIVAVVVAGAFTMLPANEKVAGANAVIEELPQIVITEVMYNPATNYSEWVELFNPSDTEINLTGWVLKDSINTTFGDLSGIVLQPYEYIIVEDTNILNDNGDTVYLYNDTYSQIDSVTYITKSTDNYSIELNETMGWQESLVEGGTPGMPNSVMNAPQTTYEIKEEELPWGWYVTNVTVTLTAQDETSVKETKYKINGGDEKTYTEPFVIEGPGVFTVEYYSIDFWGVIEDVENFTVMIANLSSALDVTPTEVNWNETHTIVVKNAEGNVGLYAPREGTPRKEGTSTYIQWSEFLFDVSGKWWVADFVDSTECNAVPIIVNPLEIEVNATPDEIDYVKVGKEGSIATIQGTATMNGEAPAGAKVRLTYPNGDSDTKDINADGSFKFLDIIIGQKGAGEYNITVYIGNETYPDASGYDVMIVNTVAPNITLKENTAKGGFDIGIVSFEITYPEDGLALLPGNNYNISIYKGDELFAWKNTTGTSNEDKVSFDINNKVVELNSSMWEAGDYTLKVWVDVTGDGNWEYVGEIDYTVTPAPPVNLKILYPADKKLDVLNASANIQVIQLQIFGGNMTTYGTPEALGIGENNENVTERIKVEGAVLYSPPRSAYEYWKDGIWNITIFPTTGKSTIYVNVSWDDETANDTIETVKGGILTIEPTEIIVETPTEISIKVEDRQTPPNYYPNARVSLYYEDEGNLYMIGEAVENGTKTGNGSPGNGQTGIYEFTISSKYADRNIIVVAEFQPPGGEITYAYGRILSQPAHDLNTTLTPEKVMAGEMTEFNVLIKRGNESYAATFEFYILNETELAKLHEGKLDLGTFTPIPYEGSAGNYTFNKYIEEEGKYYLYVRTTNKKHDNMNNEPSFDVSKASVETSPDLLVKDIDKDTTVVFTVKWEGEAVNGTLLIKGVTEVASFEAYVNDTYEIEIINGEGNLTNLTAIATGNITFKFKSAKEGSVYADADGSLEVTTPSIEITEPKEKVAFLGEENLITIVVRHPLTKVGAEGLNVEVEVPGSGMIPVGTTDENGKLLFGIIPLQTGKIKIYVEEEFAGSIDVWIGLKIVIPSGLEEDKESVIVVTTRGGKPVEGATVKVNGTSIGTTNENGEVKYTPEKYGKITITAEKDGYYSATPKTVEVKKKPSTPGFEFIGIAVAIALIALIYRKRRK
ncbi:MAG TPA: hypothetical protein ENI33_02040 [Thermoplasmatales archaeon]|nr:hypothetical protein [Thermoplasmatales archaeon]